MEKLQQAIDKVNKTFKQNNVSFRAELQNFRSNVVCIEIDGDWKHDHGYADYVMSQNNFQKTDERVVYEDGSDWYESIHYYLLNDGKAMWKEKVKTLHV